MLQRARVYAAEQGLINVSWKQSDALPLPYPDDIARAASHQISAGPRSALPPSRSSTTASFGPSPPRSKLARWRRVVTMEVRRASEAGPW